MKSFTDKSEIIRFAESFLEERIDSLEKDVMHCLREPYAPFPALLYCFSTIDLLGAIYAGNAQKNRASTQHLKNYMQKFMHYSEDQVSCLLNIFRHKVVHLSQPNPVFSHNGKNISWAYWHNDASHHLKLVPIEPPETITVTSRLSLTINHRFQISIIHLVKDIRSSVFESEGFLHSLSQEDQLQEKFDKAISEIYEPTQ